MAYGVAVISESRRFNLDANRIASVRNQFSDRVSECLGDEVLLYQSRSTKFVSGYFARGTLLGGGVSTQNARFVEMILSDLEYLRVPVPVRAAGPVVEASVRNNDGTLNGRRFAEDFRIISESEYFEIVGDNLYHQDALAHNSVGFENAAETARQKIVSQTWLRSVTVRALALPIYNYKCAITGQQLKSRNGIWTGLQVCHALSVAGGGSDIGSNLIVLCPDFHDRYDSGAIDILDDYTWIPTGSRQDHIINSWTGPKRLFVPDNPEMRLDPKFLAAHRLEVRKRQGC